MKNQLNKGNTNSGRSYRVYGQTLKFVSITLWAAAVGVWVDCSRGTPAAADRHGPEVVRKITTAKKAIAHKLKCTQKSCLFLAFWDYDGTLLKGDCSEGFRQNGKTVYRGLVELGIDQGFSKQYPKGSFDKLWKKYKSMEEKDTYAAYTYLPKIFSGAQEDAVSKMSAQHAERVTNDFLFTTSLQIWTGLKKIGIENHIISASADFFVKGAAWTKPLKAPGANVHGIELVVKNGNLTDTLVQPVTYAAGKRRKMLKITEAHRSEGKYQHAIILAGFGNSYGTDGPFLEYIARQKLPAATKATVVMINAGAAGKETPDRYKGLFTEVLQKKTTE